MSTDIIQNASAPQPTWLTSLPSSNEQIILDCTKKSRDRADSILQPSRISVPCSRGSMAGEGGKSEVMLKYNFNELTKALPLNLLYFLPTDNSKILPLCSRLSLSLCYLLCRANLTVLKSLCAGPEVAGRHMNIESVSQASLAYENTVMGAHRPQTEACTLN